MEVKACYVCNKGGHNANQRHHQEEAKKATGRLKAKKDGALLTEEDLEIMPYLFEGEPSDIDGEDKEGEETSDYSEKGWEYVSMEELASV